MLAHSTSDHAIAVTNELAQCGLHPTVATSPEHARTLVEAQGAAIVPGIGPSAQDARNLAHDLLGSKVLAVPPAEAGEEADTDSEFGESLLLLTEYLWNHKLDISRSRSICEALAPWARALGSCLMYGECMFKILCGISWEIPVSR